MEQKYVLVKLNTGETMIGSLVASESKKYTTLQNPFLYQIVSITNPFGLKMRDVLSFKKVFDFTDETNVHFLNSSIISMVPANALIINFYNKELTLLQKQQEQTQENKEEVEGETPPESPSAQAIAGNLNLNFKFDNPEDFQMFMENLQMGMDGLLEEIDEELDIDEEIEDMEDDADLPLPKQPAKRKKAKNKLFPKKSFDLPFDKDADSKDPKSWSDDPRDYL